MKLYAIIYEDGAHEQARIEGIYTTKEGAIAAADERTKTGYWHGSWLAVYEVDSDTVPSIGVDDPERMVYETSAKR